MPLAGFAPFVIYYVYLILGCVAYAAMMGSVGFLSCYYAVIKIYSALKVD